MSQEHAFEKCAGCGEHLGLSILATNLGSLSEMRIRPLRDPADKREWLPSPLVIDDTGIYCRDCGTHVTEAEELAGGSVEA